MIIGDNRQPALGRVASCHQTILAINWFIAGRLERQLGNRRAAGGTGQIDAVHLAGRSRTAAHAAAHATAIALAVLAVAIGAVHGAITGRLKGQL